MPLSTSSSRSARTDGAATSLAVSVLGVLGIVVALQTAPLKLPVLTGSDRSMQQYDRLRTQAARGEVFDWIAIGSSFTRQGVDPVEVDRMWSDRLGRTTSGSNFGSGGLAISMLSPMVTLAYDGVAPAGRAVAVFVVQPSMLFTRSAVIRERETVVASSPYGRALSDELVWRGDIARTLLDHLSIAGLRYRFKAALLPGSEGAKATTGWERLSPDGSRGFVVVDEAWTRPGPRAWRRFMKFLDGSLDVAEAADQLASALLRALELGAERVVLVEGVLHPEARSRVADAGMSPEKIRELLRAAGEKAGAVVLTLEGAPEFSEREFRDPKHLNEDGARRYSQWLGRAFPVEDVFGR